MENAREIFAPIFRDLLHLEVTLVCHPFTDRTAAPDPATQLLEIQQCYQAGIAPVSPLIQEMEVMEFGGIDSASLESLSPVAAPESEGPLDLRASFSMLAEVADAGVTAVETIRSDPQAAQFESVAGAFGSSESAGGGPSAAQLDNQEQIMLRIRENSRQICRILDEVNYQPNAIPAAESQAAVVPKQNDNMLFKPEHVMQIRKYWEVRPQDGVFMRTVIGMDGDVIAHVDPRVGGPEFAYLHKLHEQSVNTSVNFWKELVGIVTDLVSTTISSAFSR